MFKFNQYLEEVLLQESLNSPQEFYMTDDTEMPRRIYGVFELDDVTYGMSLEESDFDKVYLLNFYRIINVKPRYWSFRKPNHVRKCLSTVIKFAEACVPFIKNRMDGIIVSLPKSQQSEKMVTFAERILKRSYITTFRTVPIEKKEESAKNHIFFVRKQKSPEQIFTGSKQFKKFEFDPSALPEDVADEIKPKKKSKRSLKTTPSLRYEFHGLEIKDISIDSGIFDQIQNVQKKLVTSEKDIPIDSPLTKKQKLSAKRIKQALNYDGEDLIEFKNINRSVLLSLDKEIYDEFNKLIDFEDVQSFKNKSTLQKLRNRLELTINKIVKNNKVLKDALKEADLIRYNIQNAGKWELTMKSLNILQIGDDESEIKINSAIKSTVDDLNSIETSSTVIQQSSFEKWFESKNYRERYAQIMLVALYKGDAYYKISSAMESEVLDTDDRLVLANVLKKYYPKVYEFYMGVDLSDIGGFDTDDLEEKLFNDKYILHSEEVKEMMDEYETLDHISAKKSLINHQKFETNISPDDLKSSIPGSGVIDYDVSNIFDPVQIYTYAVEEGENASKKVDYILQDLGYGKEIEKLSNFSTLYDYSDTGYEVYNPQIRDFASLYFNNQFDVMKPNKYYLNNAKKLYKNFTEITPLPEPLWVYRSADLPENMAKSLEEGGDFIDPACMSTTLDSKMIFRMNVPARFRIFLPKGSSVIPLTIYARHHTEKEVILPPFSILKIVDIDVVQSGLITRRFITAIYIGSAFEDFIDKVTPHLSENILILNRQLMSEERNDDKNHKFEDVADEETVKALQDQLKKGKLKYKHNIHKKVK